MQKKSQTRPIKAWMLVLPLLILAVAGTVIFWPREVKPTEDKDTALAVAARSDEDEEQQQARIAIEKKIQDEMKQRTAESAPKEKAVKQVGILTEAEEESLRGDALQAAALCTDTVLNMAEQSAVFTQEQQVQLVKQLGGQGFIATAENLDMENYEKLEAFYAAYSAQSDAMVTVYTVEQSRALTALTFVYRGGGLQSYYVSVRWRADSIPEIKGTGVNELEEIRMTEKGYFFYTNTVIVSHGNLREYFRVKPLPEECKTLTERYISGLSYVNYTMLIKNWDENSAGEILMPCMFEDLYRIDTGENYQTENNRIPAALYERIMTTYLPLTVEQLRTNNGYNADSESYPYDMIFTKRYPPFGEVVDFTKNDDGTLTLFVDGVWPDYNSDYAFTNRIIVRPFADGSFRYLSNSIEKQEMEIPVY